MSNEDREYRSERADLVKDLMDKYSRLRPSDGSSGAHDIAYVLALLMDLERENLSASDYKRLYGQAGEDIRLLAGRLIKVLENNRNVMTLAEKTAAKEG